MPDHVGSAGIFAAAGEIDEVATYVAQLDVEGWVGAAGEACRDRLITLCADLVRLRGDLRHTARLARAHEQAVADAALVFTALARGAV